MSFVILSPCPHCNALTETSLGFFFGEGQTEIQRYCTSCNQHFMLIASFSTALVDQVLINSPEFQASANGKNFSKAQPKRELNKRIRMWRTIASTCKQLKVVLNVASELSPCAPVVDEIISLVKETRGRLVSEGVIGDGKG